jgi:molecular chaperone DnaJ
MVSSLASPEVINAAWRSLCKLYHPDVKKGQEKRMAAINVAYNVLSDPQKRRTYDQSLKLGR